MRINSQDVTTVQPNGTSTVFDIDPGISLPVEVEAVLAVPPNRITTHNCTFSAGVSYSITYTDDGMSLPTVECVETL